MTPQRAKELLPIFTAFAEGKVIQVKSYNDEWINLINPAFDDLSIYRIKPDPKYRPWKPEEVPVGCLIRPTKIHIAGSALIIQSDSNNIYFGNNYEISLFIALNNYEHSLDHGKTWQPCGVLE